MFTISNIIADIQRGILSHNLDEEYYSYRIIFFVNEGDNGFKHYVNASYSGLRKALEGIVRGHLSVTNSIVIAQTTVLKDGKCICLQNRSYAFSLDEYFKGLCGKKEKKYINSNYGGGKANWY